MQNPTAAEPVTNHNTHPMTTRAKSGVFKPKVLVTNSTPKSAKQSLSDTNGQQL